MKTVLISGASGFIGQHIAKKLKNSGFRTVGLSRNIKPIPHCDAVYKAAFMEPLEKALREEKIDTFVHCAYYKGKSEFEFNVQGTRLWADQAKKGGVPLQIFLSSLSAKENSLSSYGRAKFELEKWFEFHNQISLRLGLVIGNGGLFLKLVNLVKKFPVLPIPDKGKTWVYLTGIDTLCDFLFGIIRNPDSSIRGKTWNFFQSEPASMRMVLAGIQKEYKSSCVFIPVPSQLILGFLRVFEQIPFLKMSVSTNNIVGIRQNNRLDLDSDFHTFGFSPSHLEDLIRKSRERI